MSSPISRIILAVWVLPAVVAVVAAADQPLAPQDSKSVVQAAPAKDPGKKPIAPPAPQPAAPAGGMVVFVDPATGQIRQPDASEIGSLSPAGSTSQAPKAPVTMLQGPGGAVGARLNADSMTYMVVTTAPDGKLAMDCVTGDKAANARVAPGKSNETPQVQRSQDTHDVKVPR